MFNKEPDYHFLRTFGCACFPLLRPYHTHKLNFWSQECLFLGYSLSHKGYKCLSSSDRIYISKDVSFNELRFPYTDLFPSSSNSTKNLDSYFSLNPNLSPPFVAPIPQTSQASLVNSSSIPLISLGFSPLPAHSPITTVSVPCPSTSSAPIPIQPQNFETTNPTASASESVSIPNSIPVNTHPMQTRSKSGIHNPRLHPSPFTFSHSF